MSVSIAEKQLEDWLDVDIYTTSEEDYNKYLNAWTGSMMINAAGAKKDLQKIISALETHESFKDLAGLLKQVDAKLMPDYRYS